MYALDMEKLGPAIPWAVVVNDEEYLIHAYSSASAVRQALIVYLDVARWDDDGQLLYQNLSLGDILEALPDTMNISAEPLISGEFEAEEQEEKDFTLN